MKKVFKKLAPQDSIAVIAPASAAPLERLNRGLDWYVKHRFNLSLPKDLLRPKLFFASPLDNQVRHIIQALHSDSPIIWCLRGGYGSARLIPYLEELKKPTQKKLLIGFSDITALHLYLGQKWGWPTLHGRVLTQMGDAHADRVLYKKLLAGELKEVRFKGLVPMNAAAKKVKSIKGTVTGGNLRLLECSIGTAWELEARGKILFLEDVGERGYSIHRMLVHLTQAGLLEGVKAVVLGDFTEGEEKDGTDRTREALEAFAAEAQFPVLRGMPCGHAAKNHPLPLHTPATLRLGRRGELSVKTGF